MGKKPTIQTIADLAGVSRGTVDRVLNNRSYVKAEVRERVLQIVREIGYESPREVHLREQETSLRPLRLGVLLPNWGFGHQFLDEVRKGISEARDELEDAKVEIIVKQCSTDLPEEAVNLLRELRDLEVDGFSVCVFQDQSIEKELLAMKEQSVFYGGDVFKMGIYGYSGVFHVANIHFFSRTSKFF